MLIKQIMKGYIFFMFFFIFTDAVLRGEKENPLGNHAEFL